MLLGPGSPGHSGGPDRRTEPPLTWGDLVSRTMELLENGNMAVHRLEWSVSPVAWVLVATEPLDVSARRDQAIGQDNDATARAVVFDVARCRRLRRTLLWIGWTWWTVRQFRAAMTRVDTEMGAGRFGAARDLERILARNPGSGEAAYVLGICEQARGRNEQADQAWARVAPGSSFLQRAVLARLRLFHDTGRLAIAERLILDAAKDPRNDRTDLLVLLVPVFSEIGRSDEAARLIEDRWEDLKQRGEATPEQSIKLVRLHIELTWTAPSVENLRVYLDQASRLASQR